MSWVVEQAKNNELTLKVNNVYIYSKYNPKNDVERFINTLSNEDFYIVLGLGLGYHIESLLETKTNTKVYGVALDKEDLAIFKKYASVKLQQSANFTLIQSMNVIEDFTESNLVIPVQWTKALGVNHQLTAFLEDVKLRQLSRNRHASLLDSNFEYTKELDTIDIHHLQNIMAGKTACLVASGPSLNETVAVLKSTKNKYFILAVSSCLNVLKLNDIEPDAIIISDAKAFVKYHFHSTDFKVPLLYLATASKEAIKYYEGPKIKLYQEGYEASEICAKKEKQPLFEVGGSVATLGFSLLNYLGFSTILLFGQDLGFRGEHTHAADASSGVMLNQEFQYKELIANDDQYNKVSKSLYTYWRWFDKHVPLSKAKVLNTALTGTKISGAQYVKVDVIMQNLANTDECDFSSLFV